MKAYVLAATLLLVVSFTNTFAQTTNATLGGTVSDSSKALIPGVTVTATNTQTGIVSSNVTNETGAYNFPSLQTGTYKVTAELPGFQTQTYNDVTLGVSQQVRLNFALAVSGQTQSVEVNVAADTLIATTSASVGNVLPEYKVRDLPLASRNILDLTTTSAGTQGSNFAGGRLTLLNTTRDGIPVSDGRYDTGAATTTFVSPDLVDEVRVIVAPADAEMGRGSGQIQMTTRSGTNNLHGSLFWVNRNSVLNANSWNNNFQNAGKDYYNGNQFGARVGGPIIKNKTFFFFLFDGQRFLTKGYFTGTVLTDLARQGTFRYFPGVQNGNILANIPTVDRGGAPVKPLTATGDLQSFNVFQKADGTPWDPNRTGFDTSGWIKTLITRMPSPNDYTVGDGLNTAGYRWLRRSEGQDTANGDGNDTNRNQYNVRIDHNFNQRHKATFSGTWERDSAETSQAGLTSWPGGYDGLVSRAPRVITGSFVSTLSPTIVNEFRLGTRKAWNYSWSSIWRPDAVGAAARAILPTHGGKAFYPNQALIGSNIINSVSGAATRGQQSPIYDFSDTLSWTKGKHAFRIGYDARFSSSVGFNGSDNPDFYTIPVITVSAGGNAIQGIPSIGTSCALQPAPCGLTGTSLTSTAPNLLLDLSGSVGDVSISNGFSVISNSATGFSAQTRVKNYHQNEWSAFVKDDWKVRSDLTLNLGVRYDFYGVPYELHGLNASPVGGQAGLLGISGPSGQPTQLQLVGKNSTHPNVLLYQNDRNNFGPAVGFSWSLPWGGKEKTVVRGGYGIFYQGAASFNANLSLFVGNNPGLSTLPSLTSLGLGSRYFNFSSADLPIPVPVPANVTPLSTEPLGVKSNPVLGFADNRVNPYIQNFNFEIQREIAKNLTIQTRYIGSKGTRLYGGLSLNDVNINDNGILNAFNITRAGGNAQLFDQMLNGITLNPGTNATLGQGPVNGATVSGSAALRGNSSFKTFIANGNVGQFASLLNTSTIGGTGRAGGLFTKNGFPENFISANPQYAAAIVGNNPGSSTYHSLNIELTKRLSHGFTNQFAYTWSKALGENDGDGAIEYWDPKNPHLNHTRTGFDRTHDFRSNGTFELPFGPGRPLLANAPKYVSRFVERWQLGGIFHWSTGAPVTITASNAETTWSPIPATVNLGRTPNTPLINGSFPNSSGKITYTGSGANYFNDLTQVDDPAKSGITSAQTVSASFSNKALKDASGNIVLSNPAPGTIGNLGRQWITGPTHANFDVNLVKRIRVGEGKEFEIRLDAVNVMNNPSWTFVTGGTDINNASFGKLLAADPTGGVTQATNTVANRRFTFNARLTF
jgi:Carboxypeptidase regulatory-like domain